MAPMIVVATAPLEVVPWPDAEPNKPPWPPVCDAVPQAVNATDEATTRTTRIFMFDTGSKSPPAAMRFGDKVDI
jgi:hypothetical protein